MKNKRSILVICITIFSLLICTNVYAKTKITQSGLKITSSENWYWATKYFGLVEFKFENTTQEWIRIKDVKVSFKDVVKNENIKFTSGRDLAIWGEIVEDIAINRERTVQGVLGTIAAVGAGIAISSDNSNLKAFSAATSIGAAISLSVMEFNKKYIDIEMAKIFPKGHLFAEEFVIPPGLHINRFLVLNTRNHKKIGYLEKIFLELQAGDKKPEKVEVSFRATANDKKRSSQWQKELLDDKYDER